MSAGKTQTRHRSLIHSHIRKSSTISLARLSSFLTVVLKGGNSRERADALGRVADVPNLDVGGGDGEDQTGGRRVFDGHHVVRVALQRDDLLTRYQVPHLAGAIWRRDEFQHSETLSHYVERKQDVPLKRNIFAPS